MFVFRSIVLSSLASLLAVSSVAYADWADAVFPVKKHNFGTVAVGSKTEFRFPIHNNLDSPIHIRSVRASCGCTTPIIETESIAPGESGSILARFNTPTFRGKKGATLTVVMDQPFFSEVRLRVDGYIRSDMVFHPGAIEFGSIRQGELSEGTTKLYYAGRSDWQVVDVRSNKPWLVPTFRQTQRGQGKVNYDLTVQVREDAPAGFFQDEVIVQTNDRSMPRVPLRVSGKVETPLVISPQSIALGPVSAGQPLTQRMVIRGQQPFRLGDITCEGWDVDFQTAESAKKIHVLTVTFTPTEARGPQRSAVVISTAGESSVSAKAILTAEVQAPTSTEPGEDGSDVDGAEKSTTPEEQVAQND